MGGRCGIGLVDTSKLGSSFFLFLVSITNNDIYISGYEIVRRDRTSLGADGKPYGGVCFYVRSSVNFLLRPDLSVSDLENLCIEIRKPNSKPFLVATWYRSPESTVDKFDLFETIDKIDAENIEYYLLGDLNCNVTATIPDHSTRVLTNLTELYGLKQVITEPTRVTESSSTTIDLLFSNAPDKIVCSVRLLNYLQHFDPLRILVSAGFAMIYVHRIGSV